ncbi:MAG: hypothetical protein ONB12_05045 [candidate division KSB1 bacterium]|nr:hypothetical protein [candidate division KSB1 bacterium]
MNRTKEKLLQILRRNFDQTVTRICNRLQKIRPSHYEIIDFERHQEREEEFLNLICNALEKDDLDSLKKYMAELANIRHNEGYTLEEVQKALDAIEEELWQTISRSGEPCEEIVAMLHEMNRLMVCMRNQFAVSYAAKQVDVQKRMARLKERFFIYRHDRKDLESQNRE